MAPPRYVLYNVLLLCALAGYSLAEPSLVTVKNAGERRLTGDEKNFNFYVNVRASNMNATLVDAATRILVTAYATLDKPSSIMSYFLSHFLMEVPWGSGWNYATVCGELSFYTDYYIILAAYVNGVLSGEYLVFSVNP